MPIIFLFIATALSLIRSQISHVMIFSYCEFLGFSPEKIKKKKNPQYLQHGRNFGHMLQSTLFFFLGCICCTCKFMSILNKCLSSSLKCKLHEGRFQVCPFSSIFQVSSMIFGTQKALYAWRIDKCLSKPFQSNTPIERI